MNYQNNWGQSARLGKSTAVTNQYAPMGAEGNFQQVLDIARNDENEEIRNFNLMTWIGGYTLPDVSNANLAILGKCEYGIGGVGFSFDFDWKMGTQISVAASFIRISAAYSEIGTNTPPEVRIAAMASYGSRAARSQVTRSYPLLTVSDSTVVLFPIPPLAHALNLFSLQQAFYDADNVQIRYLAGASAGFSTTSTSLVSWISDGQPFAQALATEDGVRFPETARFVEVTVEAADTTYEFTPCFTLSL